MKKQDVTAIDSYFINEETYIPDTLNKDLYHFLAKSYHLANQDEFNRLIMRPEIDGELTIHYGLNDEIAGFTRTYKQTVDMSKKQITVYSAYIYLNPQFKSAATIESAGLSHAIHYKLNNPQEELIYLAFANNPLTYEFLTRLSDSIYPKSAQNIPAQIIHVIDSFKSQNGWISTSAHPMVINSPLVPLRSQSLEFYNEDKDSNQFYWSVNPDYLQGNSLLVYIPLHLANISYGLHHSDPSYCYTQKRSHNAHFPQPSNCSHLRS